jgi:predicted RNase H-like HicB family nuclease
MNINVKTYVFKVVIEDDAFEDGRPAYRAYCPALQQYGAATWGETQAETLRRIQEVVEMVVEELLEEGVQLPESQSPDVQVFADPRVAVTI